MIDLEMVRLVAPGRLVLVYHVVSPRVPVNILVSALPAFDRLIQPNVKLQLVDDAQYHQKEGGHSHKFNLCEGTSCFII